MKTNELTHDEVRQVVRDRYGRIATTESDQGCGGGGCCVPSTRTTRHAEALGYTPDDSAAVPVGADLGLGCGNPVAIGALRPGQTVLDLGSGAGFDALLAARAVGPQGRVIGVDMTPAMITRARENQARSGHRHVEFRLGEIENLPVADASVDVILSNCVINLSPEKARVIAEAWRVLRPGGRLALADVVAWRPIPAPLRQDWELHTGCVAGAATREELTAWLQAAGFEEIRIEPKADGREIVGEWFPGQSLEQHVVSATIEAVKPLAG